MRIVFFIFIFFYNLYALDFTLKDKALYNELSNYDKKYKISESKEWRDLSGWTFGVFGYSANNQDQRGYANPKGLNNPREDFIEFAMEFIHPHITTVENSIKCRTPKKYTFLKKLFKNFSSPLEQKDIVCYKIDDGFLNDLSFISPINGKPIDFRDINENNIEGFELLYATPGTADASEIAGHLLLRIKLSNNPLAKKLHMENPHDIVVSFLANTKDPLEEYNEPKIQKKCNKNFFNIVENDNFNAMKSIYQSLKGLAGGFLTMMDRQTLQQTIKNYTIEEDRNLLRFELILTQKQKKSLIHHLFRVKKNYNARYYFFTQNCASVLVKVIGQGINVKEIANFEPITSAPNTLVALFTRLGLAKPIYPSFYSYRKKAYMAQDTIEKYYNSLKEKYSKLKWPDISLLLNKSTQNRVKFIDKLIEFYKTNQRLEDELYKLSNLIQTAEMSYEYKELLCEEYTPEVTKKIRAFQVILLPKIKEFSPLDIESFISKKYTDFKKEEYEKGENHTQLLSFGFGLGRYEDKNLLHLEGSVVKQEMGSLSNIAMQRGNSVQLGNFELNLIDNEEISTWSFSALNIKKFKERLEYIPSFFSYSGEFGLALNALDYKGDKIQKSVEGSIMGGELLFNLISSNSHEDYIYTSIGSQIAYQKYNDKSSMGLMFPIYIQNMFTFGEKRELQWQNKFLYNKAYKEKMDSRKNITSELRYKLPLDKEEQYLLKLKYDYQYKSKNLAQNKTLWIGIEINNW